MKRRTLLQLWTYFRAAPLPHLLTLASFGISEALAFWACVVEGPLVAVPLRISSLGWVGLAFLAQADAFCRWREYRRVKAMLQRRGFFPRIMHPLSRSRCQRDAGVFAAKQAGFGVQARNHYRTMGYRWYHLMPDMVVQNPLNFLNSTFLRSTFVPTRKMAHEASRR